MSICESMNPIRTRSNSDAGQRISLSKGDLIREHEPIRSTFLIPLVAMLAFIFDIDGTLVDSNEFHVDSWDRAFRRFGKQFPREKLRPQIGKGSDQYLPEFLTPDDIDRFGKLPVRSVQKGISPKGATVSESAGTFSANP